MKKVEAYKCDFCSKASTNAGAMAQHERKCKANQNNKHKCFDYCTHLKRQYAATGHPRFDFQCAITGKLMYSYKAEHRGFDLKGLERMPLQCEHFKDMNWEEIDERFNSEIQIDD